MKVSVPQYHESNRVRLLEKVYRVNENNKLTFTPAKAYYGPLANKERGTLCHDPLQV